MYRIGYQRAVLTEQVKRIPFDIEWYLRLYELCSYVNSADEYASIPEYREDDARVLLYGILQLYDANKEKYPEIGMGSLRFKQNVKKAREIVENFELVSIQEVFEILKEESRGGQGQGQGQGDQVLPAEL